MLVNCENILALLEIAHTLFFMSFGAYRYQLLRCLNDKMCRLPRDTQPGLLRAKDASKKLMDLGLEFIPMDQIIKDAVESLRSKGYIT